MESLVFVVSLAFTIIAVSLCFHSFRNEPLRRRIGITLGLAVMLLCIFGIPQDAFLTWDLARESDGPHWRFFLYRQTVRMAGPEFADSLFSEHGAMRFYSHEWRQYRSGS